MNKPECERKRFAPVGGIDLPAGPSTGAYSSECADPIPPNPSPWRQKSSAFPHEVNVVRERMRKRKTNHSKRAKEGARKTVTHGAILELCVPREHDFADTLRLNLRRSLRKEKKGLHKSFHFIHVYFFPLDTESTENAGNPRVVS